MRLSLTKEIIIVCIVLLLASLALYKLTNILVLDTQLKQFVFEALWHIAYCTFIFAVVYKIEGRDLLSLNIRFDNILIQLLIGVTIGLLLISPVIYNVFIAKTMSPHITGLDGQLTFIKIFPSIFNELIFVGFTEELIFRGYLFSRVSEVSNIWVGLAVSSILFGLVHFPINGDIVQVLTATCVGCLFSLLMMLYPNRVSILSLAIAHGLYDSGVSILVYIYYMVYK